MLRNNKPQISIVVLTCNAKKLVLNCVSSLYRLTADNYRLEIIVVVNGSKDGTTEALVKMFPQIIVIDNKINYGFAKGINYGVKLAYQQKADYILILNDDTKFSPDFLETLFREAQHNSYEICGPKILTPDKKIWSLGGKIDKRRYSGGLIGYGEKDCSFDECNEVDFISGTAILVRRDVFKKIGFFDEDYFLYYDDVDFCCRALKKGIKSHIVSGAVITHLETITIKKNSPSHYYHAKKSHLIFVFKRAPFLVKLRELMRFPKTLIELSKEKNKTKQKYELLAINDFFQGKIGQNSSIKPFLEL